MLGINFHTITFTSKWNVRDRLLSNKTLCCCCVFRTFNIVNAPIYQRSFVATLKRKESLRGTNGLQFIIVSKGIFTSFSNKFLIYHLHFRWKLKKAWSHVRLCHWSSFLVDIDWCFAIMFKRLTEYTPHVLRPQQEERYVTMAEIIQVLEMLFFYNIVICISTNRRYRAACTLLIHGWAATAISSLCKHQFNHFFLVELRKFWWFLASSWFPPRTVSSSTI